MLRRSLEQLDLFVHAPPSPAGTRRRPPTMYGKAQGQVYDLDEFFCVLNERYLWNRLTRPVLRWSRNRWRIVLGICDVERQVITLNRALDDSRVPDIVVASTLFHEMLHLHFGIDEDANGRRRVHPPEFKRAEKGLPGYHEAEIWIQRCFPLRGRPAKKPRTNTDRFLSSHALSAPLTGTGRTRAGISK
ncbi:MAG: SprT-like domain-containing protein [bacterium]